MFIRSLPKSIRAMSLPRLGQRFLSRGFSADTSWQQLSIGEKMSCALAESTPHDADAAFFKGFALKELGKAYTGEAISAFEVAAEKDPQYKPICAEQIAVIYEQLGELWKSNESLKKALAEWKKAVPNHGEISEKERLVVQLEEEVSRHLVSRCGESRW